MCSIKPNNRGFTLLEVLIALALLTVVAGALYGTYFSVYTGRETAAAGMERRRELRTTLDQLRRELSAAYFRRNPGGSQAKGLSHFVVEDRDTFGKPTSGLTFTTVAAPSEGAQPVSDLMDLRYQVIEKDGHLVLARQGKDLYLIGDPLRFPQMEELEGFLVECFDGSKWVKSWDTSLNLKLPQMVRITITVKEGDRSVEYTSLATPRMNMP